MGTIVAAFGKRFQLSERSQPKREDSGDEVERQTSLLLTGLAQFIIYLLFSLRGGGVPSDSPNPDSRPHFRPIPIRQCKEVPGDFCVRK